MTKDEIKKALECCAKSYGDDVHCSNCPYDTLTPCACYERFCQDVLCKDALDLITEQEKEIDRLKAEARLFQKIGDDAHKWRFEAKRLPKAEVKEDALQKV